MPGSPIFHSRLLYAIGIGLLIEYWKWIACMRWHWFVSWIILQGLSSLATSRKIDFRKPCLSFVFAKWTPLFTNAHFLNPVLPVTLSSMFQIVPYICICIERSSFLLEELPVVAKPYMYIYIYIYTGFRFTSRWITCLRHVIFTAQTTRYVWSQLSDIRICMYMNTG